MPSVTIHQIDKFKLDRALEQFEGFCTVTQSVRAAIPIRVNVVVKNGVRLK